MTALWIALALIAAAVLVLLLAPVEARLSVRPSGAVSVRVRWFGVPLKLEGERAGEPEEERLRRRGRRKRRRGGEGGFDWRRARAVVVVLQTPGLVDLGLKTVRRALRAMHLVRAELTVAAGLRHALWLGPVKTLLSLLRPDLSLTGSRWRFEFLPDFQNPRLRFDGDLVVYTRPIAWVGLGLSLALSPTLWRAWRRWRRATKRDR